jgi:GAF domain-containing protein
VPFDPVLDAVMRAAVSATGATNGWIVEPADERLRVVAAAGGEAGTLVDREIDGSAGGTVGLVLASGPPMALSPRPDDPRATQGVASLLGVVPASVLCVPCGDDEVVGALELVDKTGGGSFSFDDVEIATLLAGIAGVGITARTGGPDLPTPAELASALERLAVVVPSRYSTVARIVGALLAGD